MQKIAIIAVTAEGQPIAARLANELHDAAVSTLPRAEVGARWSDFDAFVFIGAMGICVRTIAPHITTKQQDPAVVCIDSLGRNVISVLSGHIGGANDLTRTIAACLGGHEVITTQSDQTGLWPVDCLEHRFTHWTRITTQGINPAVFAFVNRKPVALILGIRDEGTAWMEATKPDHVTVFAHEEWQPEWAERYAAIIVVSPFTFDTKAVHRPVIHYCPRVLTMGLGLAHEAQPAADVWSEITDSLTAHAHVLPEAIGNIATIDLKATEPVIQMLQNDRLQNCKFHFFSAQQLSSVAVPTPSEVVAQHVGTPSVCEAAALLAAQPARLLTAKTKGRLWTYAIAAPENMMRQTTRRGHIEIVGAGPGDPELVSVRGRRFLQQADLILYAGSLVPRELTECHKPGAVVRSSADMNLEEQCALMQQHYEQGHLIVRLHTGDPCIFGAIQEQMAFFDDHNMDYHITPGISSFLAAAAELRSQFTIPERTQTIILTRGEGRTPMPEREKLHLLARSQSTMCIFLSAAIVDDVQRELLQEYPEDTPVAACYHLTWPDQHIYRGRLKDLSRIVHDNNLTLTTMLVVGDAIDNRHGLSALYDKHFTHLFRQGVSDTAEPDTEENKVQ